MNLEEVSLDWKEKEVWDSYVENASSGSVFHLFSWKDIIKESYGHKPYYLAANNNGNIVGILPLYFLRLPLLGSSLVSVPYLDYAGICAETKDIRNLLLENAVRLAQGKKIDNLNLRELRQEKWPGLVTDLDKVTMELELVPKADVVWKRMSSKRRNKIRMAEKTGMHVEIHGAERLEDFYRIYSTNMRDLGSPVHSLLFFQKIFQYLPEKVHLFLALKEEMIIGASICLKFGETLTISWASSLRDYFSLRPNETLYWEAIKWGCVNGYKVFDFGRSTVGSGTYEFKKLWGARPRQIYWQYIMFNGNRAPQADPKKWKFSSLVIHTWQNLPLPLANKFGPLLRRYISN